MEQILALQNELITATHRGFAFLLVNGVAWLGAGLLAWRVAPRRVALWLLLQGFWTIPASLGLERVLGFAGVSNDNPLAQLALLLPFTQSVAITAVLLTLRQQPASVPAIFSAIVGGHFVPYWWVYRSPVYLVLGVAISLFPFLVALRWPQKSTVLTPLIVGTCLIVGALLVY